MLKTQPLVKNGTEKKLLQDLSQQGEAAGATLKQLQQVQQMHTTYKNLWSQLLVCRRSNLMSLIPLTSQWLEQLSVTATSLSSVLQGQLAPLQPLIDRLAVFASAHKSTAEELQAAGAAQALAAEKLALSQMESQIIDSLTCLIEASRRHTQEAAASAAQLPPPPTQQRSSPQPLQQQQQQAVSQLFAQQGSPALSGRSGPQQQQVQAQVAPSLQTGLQQQQQQQAQMVPPLQTGLQLQQPSPASGTAASAMTPSGAFSLPDLPPKQMQQLLRILDGQTHTAQQQQHQQSSQGVVAHGVSSSRAQLGHGVEPINQQVAQQAQQQHPLQRQGSLLQQQQQQQQQLTPPPMQQQQQHNRVEQQTDPGMAGQQQAKAVPAHLQNWGRMRQLTQQLQQGKQHEQQHKRKQQQQQQQQQHGQQHQQRHQQFDLESQGSLQHKRRRLVDADSAHIGGPQLRAVTTEPPMAQHRPPTCAQQHPLQPQQQQLLVQQHKQQQQHMGWQQELQHTQQQQQQQQHGASNMSAGPLSLGLLAARSSGSNMQHLQQASQHIGQEIGQQQEQLLQAPTQQQQQQQQWGQAGMSLPALPSQLLRDTWGALPVQHAQTAALGPFQGLGQPLQPLTSALQQQQHPPLQPLTAALQQQQQQQRPDRAALVQSVLAAAATAASKSAEQRSKADTIPVHVRAQQVLAMLQQQQEQQQQQQLSGQNQKVAEPPQHLEVQHPAQPLEQQQACPLPPPPPQQQSQEEQQQQQQIADVPAHLDMQQLAQPVGHQQASPLLPPPQQQQPQPQEQQQHPPGSPQQQQHHAQPSQQQQASAPPLPQQQQQQQSPRQLQRRRTSECSSGKGSDFLDAVKAQLTSTGTAGVDTAGNAFAASVPASPEPFQQPSHPHGPSSKALSEPAAGPGVGALGLSVTGSVPKGAGTGLADVVPYGAPSCSGSAGASNGSSADAAGPAALPAVQTAHADGSAGGSGKPQQGQQQQAAVDDGVGGTAEVHVGAEGLSNGPMAAAEAAAATVPPAASVVGGPQQQVLSTASNKEPGLAGCSVTAPQNQAQAEKQQGPELGQATAGPDDGQLSVPNGPLAAPAMA